MAGDTSPQNFEKRGGRNGNTIRVLLADDHQIVRQGLAAIIEGEADMTVVAQASDGAAAIEEFALHRPDVVLMDLRMPNVGGVAAIASILKSDRAAKIMVLTTFDGDEDVYRAVRAGAVGYLLKDAPVEELLNGIRKVFSGGKQISPAVAQLLAERIAGDELTAREIDVLGLMAAGKSNREIAEELFVSESTVKFHVNNILGKLQVADRTRAVIVALKRGFIRLK